MFKFLVALMSVLSLGLSGCAEDKRPAWFKFGRFHKEKPEVTKQIEGTVLADVNGRIITLEDFEKRIQTYNAGIQASQDISDSAKSDYLITSPGEKKELLNRMIERKLLVAEAEARALDQDKDYKKAIAALKEQLLFDKIVEKERVKATVTTREIENFYNRNKAAFAIPEERKVSMIVVSTEEKAKEILIALLQGADFVSLARAHSIDKQSATLGGDIGFIVRTSPFPQTDNKKTMFAKFEEVAFTLELNKPSAIFQGPDGFYIIKVTEIKQSRQMLLSEVYSDIEQGLLLKKQEEALNGLIGNLRKAGNVIVHDDLLKE